MSSTSCPNGRQQATALAAMNLRAVVGPDELIYIAPARRKLAAVRHPVGPRFQPRDEAGRFVPYADLWDAMNLEYAWTAYEHDVDAALAAAARTGGTAVLLNPTPVAGVTAVAAEGERMPRKSTLFTPKPRTGLVLRDHRDA